LKTRQRAIEVLRAHGVKLDLGSKLILLYKTGPGLKLWSMVDCLCNYYGFHWTREQN
jgi:hypothetical protein